MSYLAKVEADLFDEIRGMGDLPADAQPIASLESYRGRFPRLTPLATLRSGGVTHFTATPGGTAYTFWFFDATGARKGNQALSIPESERSSDPIQPQKEYAPYTLAPLPGDGLLPSETAEERTQAGPTGMQRWLPWALVGGAVVVGGGIVWAVSRRPVTANRRRRSRTRRQSSRRVR